VEYRQVAGYATLDKFLKDQISGGDSNLGAASGRVVNLHGNARAGHHPGSEFKTRQRVTGNIGLNNFFDYVNRLLDRFDLDGGSTSSENKGQSYQH
jgi:hypothetical protein